MKIETYKFPKSSFLSIEKDMGLIVDKIIKDERLKKLLYYNTSDALDKPNIGDDKTYELFGKNIKMIPKFKVDKDVYNYLLINFDDFSPSENPEFRDNIIIFDIICHYDQWNLRDFQLRPYKIAAELDTLFNNQHLTGIGDLQFFGASQISLGDEFAGLCVMYQATHGVEDKKRAPVPNDDLDQRNSFDEIFNSGK